MDRGEFIKRGFVCEPGESGGWIVQRYGASQRAAFSAFAEMIAWLQSEHEALEGVKGRPEPGSEGRDSPQVIRHCGYLNCTAETPFSGCPIHGASDA